jgi:hypothetical protein
LGSWWAEYTSFHPHSTHFESFIAGFQWSIIDYAHKIEDLYAKMEGVRSLVLPPNRQAVDRYHIYIWEVIHSLTAAVLPRSSQSSGPDDAKKFESYLEAEEARLGNNLRAVDYVIDGIDTLSLITGAGRIEKVRIQQCTLQRPHFKFSKLT